MNRTTGSSYVSVVDDVHQSACGIDEEARRSSATRKGFAYISLRTRDGRAIGNREIEQRRVAVIENVLGSHGSRCGSCYNELVSAVYSEQRPILDRLDCFVPHAAKYVNVMYVLIVYLRPW